MKLKFAKPDKKPRKGLKIDSLDKLFSLYIRTRDKWTCQRCWKQFTPPTNVLQNSHFYGRTMHSVRYDPENCDSLCYGCHRYWEKEDREGYRAFKIKQLGQKGFDMLTIAAFKTGKPDVQMLKITYKKLLTELV
jgi:hypothetical protein